MRATASGQASAALRGGSSRARGAEPQRGLGGTGSRTPHACGARCTRRTSAWRQCYQRLATGRGGRGQTIQELGGQTHRRRCCLLRRPLGPHGGYHPHASAARRRNKQQVMSLTCGRPVARVHTAPRAPTPCIHRAAAAAPRSHTSLRAARVPTRTLRRRSNAFTVRGECMHFVLRCNTRCNTPFSDAGAVTARRCS